MADQTNEVNSITVAQDMLALIRELYPICRSITGDGLRQTLQIVGRHIPLQVHEVPTGTRVLDWTVPKEWNIRDAYVADSSGQRVIDFRKHNLHVVNYSVPVHARMPLSELRPHLHTLRDHPDLIPYRTSYYNETWGFCLSQQQLDSLPEDEYEVHIDSSLEPGSLSYGELFIPGDTDAEILISAHSCHPSLANDNLSGIAVATFLARALLSGAAPGKPGPITQTKRKYGVRFLFAPGTIGALAWLAHNRERAQRVIAGLTLTNLGDYHPFTFKRSVFGGTLIDRAAEHVLQTSGLPHQFIDFFPYGYDERQYNSPGFRMPVGSLMRGRHGKFREYHTSADNLDFVSGERLHESLRILSDILAVLDGDHTYTNLQPYGEPQLGSRGLYNAIGGTQIADLQLALLWVLNLSDSQRSLLDIAERAHMPFSTIRTAADLLLQHELLSPVTIDSAKK